MGFWQLFRRLHTSPPAKIKSDDGKSPERHFKSNAQVFEHAQKRICCAGAMGVPCGHRASIRSANRTVIARCRDRQRGGHE